MNRKTSTIKKILLQKRPLKKSFAFSTTLLTLLDKIAIQENRSLNDIVNTFLTKSAVSYTKKNFNRG